MKVIMMLFKLCGCKKIFVYFKKKPTSAPSSPTKNSGSRSSISTSAPNSQVRTIESESVPDISKVSQVAPVETSVLSDLPLLSSSVDALDRLHTADSLEDGAKVSWSGKILNPKESRKYFEILTDSTTELPGVDLVKELPHQFIVTKNDDAVDQSDATSETVRTEKTKEVSSRQAESL